MKQPIEKEAPRSFSTILPARLICGSFALVILVGTLLLILPISSRSGTFTPPLDALFTATSATCVTGLVIYDTYLHWSAFGQGVILALIQCGGLGLVTFITFFNVIIGRKMGLRGLDIAKESIGSDNFSDIRSMVTFIVASSLVIEGVGAVILSTRLVPLYGLRQGIFMAIFTSVSAFCNAGFDLFGREGAFASLMPVANDPVIIGTVALLIILGGLGFVVYLDLLRWRKRRTLRLHSWMVLWMTGILIVGGMVVIYLFEFNNPHTMGHLTLPQQLGASFFQSVTSRTAGFNSVDIASLRDATKVSMMMLMFVGAAPASTGGGIKVTTLAVLITTVLGVVRGRDETIIRHRRVKYQAVYKAMAVFTFGFLLVTVSTAIIYMSLESKGHIISVVDVMFEEISAFATVGLTTGITSICGWVGKTTLILSMFIGRVGSVSLALSLAMRTHSSRRAMIPDGQIMVG